MENIYVTEASKDYELIDSGDGRKLERFGEVVISRPDPQVLWQKSQSESVWKDNSAVFDQSTGRGRWKHTKPFPEPWQVSLSGINFILKPSIFKHIGIFPEQSFHWDWLSKKIESRVLSGQKVSVLNLFSYTGGLSLACAKVGATVCHVDASQFATDSAIINRDASGLSDAPIRFIVEDVRKFVEREIRRGNKYDVICMDPPVYGKGTKDEIWKIEEDIVPLLEKIKKIISEIPLAIILNGYASNYSHITYAQILSGVTKDLNGKIISGDLAIKESKEGRLLPAGIFARWEE